MFIMYSLPLLRFWRSLKYSVILVFSVMKEPECDDTPTGNTEDEDEDELSSREEGGLDQIALSHVQPPDFSMDPQSSPGEGRSSLEDNTDRPEAGREKK